MPSYDPQALTNLLRMRQSRSRPRQGGGSLLAGLGQQAAKTVSQVFADRAARPVQMLKFATQMAQLEATETNTLARNQQLMRDQGEDHVEAMNQVMNGMASLSPDASFTDRQSTWLQLLTPFVEAGVFPKSKMQETPPTPSHATVMSHSQVTPAFVGEVTTDKATGVQTTTQTLNRAGIATDITLPKMSHKELWIGGEGVMGTFNEALQQWFVPKNGVLSPITGTPLTPPDKWRPLPNLITDSSGSEIQAMFGGDPDNPYRIVEIGTGRNIPMAFPGLTSAEKDMRKWGFLASQDVKAMNSLLFGVPINPSTGQPFRDADGNTLPPLFATDDTGKGLSWKVKMLWRRGKALIGLDPVMRTYMDWLAFNSGNMARAQQSGRPSDKDIEKVIMPAWPNPLWDDRISATLKINKLAQWADDMQASGAEFALSRQLEIMKNPETEPGALVLMKVEDPDRLGELDEHGQPYMVLRHFEKQVPRPGDTQEQYPHGRWLDWHKAGDPKNPRGPYVSPQEMGFGAVDEETGEVLIPALNYSRNALPVIDGGNPELRPATVNGQMVIYDFDPIEYMQGWNDDFGTSTVVKRPTVGR